ncbi:MAG: leucyl/phenylalanyl-tRNA--protein transferase [Acidobacteria bacterium]|nr:leucyl/phenylalanyl-tRNA--protein transferase [Acidobacteriota bacterium]MCA1642164.1 leucyl/phenylalanyl-tRNA--protein transferase [Acidobacteriota bacterium]
MPLAERDQHPAAFFKRSASVMHFPDPRAANYGDIVAVGGNLEPSNLLAAYRRGIFPWPVEGCPLPWFSPRERAILEWRDLHVPRRLARLRSRSPYRLTFDAAFPQVVLNCALVERPEEAGTWITPGVLDAYCALHRLGHAHSVEAWEGDELIGGVYGVDVGGAFAGESMFFLRPNASKLALLHLFSHLNARGLDWIDIQVMTPHMKALGAKVVSREVFLGKLENALARGLELFPREAFEYHRDEV